MQHPLELVTANHYHYYLLFIIIYIIITRTSISCHPHYSDFPALSRPLTGFGNRMSARILPSRLNTEPEYAVDDEVDAAVDGDEEVVSLRQGRELRLPEMLKYFLLFYIL